MSIDIFSEYDMSTMAWGMVSGDYRYRQENEAHLQTICYRIYRRSWYREAEEDRVVR